MKLLMCLFFDNCFHINCLLKVVCLGLCMRARWRASNCVRKVIKREEGIDNGSKFASSKKVGKQVLSKVALDNSAKKYAIKTQKKSYPFRLFGNLLLLQQY